MCLTSDAVLVGCDDHCTDAHAAQTAETACPDLLQRVGRHAHQEPGHWGCSTVADPFRARGTMPECHADAQIIDNKLDT